MTDAAGMRELLMQSRDDLAKLIYMAHEPGGATIGAWEIDQKERPIITGEYQGIALKVVNFICALPIPESPTDAAVKALAGCKIGNHLGADRVIILCTSPQHAEEVAVSLANFLVANGVKV